MTVSQSIIAWLKTFECDIGKLKSIDTDVISSTDKSFALVKEPTQNVKKYLSGKEIHTDYYQIMASLDSTNNTRRISNGDWLEKLTAWIEESNKNSNFPTLSEYETKEIGVSSPFFLGISQDNKSVYQMTIYIKYVKEN